MIDPKEPRDRHVETVLRGLQEARPAPGLEQRLLTTLRQQNDCLRKRETETRAHPLRSLWPRTFLPAAPALPWLTAATLLLSAAGALLYRAGEKTQSNSAVSTLAAADAGTCAPPAACRPAGAQTARFPPPQADTGAGRARMSGSALPTAKRAVRPASLAAAAPSPSSDGAASRGFPPPPLPLTRQELMLLSLARREPPRELAQVTTSAFQARFQHGEDEFTEFFTPPPPLRAQEDERLSESAGEQ